MLIYQPSDDSYLLAEILGNYLKSLIKDKKNIYNIKQKNNNKNKQENSVNQQSSPLKFYNIANLHRNIKILDMGSGSGIQAETCKKLGFKNILTIDINPEAIKLLKQKGFKTIKSNLFSKINPNQKFDLIIFNPPYLPEDKSEPKDSRTNTTAGKQGYEIILNFLGQAKIHLNKNGKILFLFSSLSKPNIIIKQSKALGYSLKLVSKKKLFFEDLFVYELEQ